MRTPRTREEFETVSKILVGSHADIPGHLQLVLEALLDIRELLETPPVINIEAEGHPKKEDHE